MCMSPALVIFAKAVFPLIFFLSELSKWTLSEGKGLYFLNGA